MRKILIFIKFFVCILAQSIRNVKNSSHNIDVNLTSFSIDSSAKISPNTIHQKERCDLSIGYKTIVEGGIFFERNGAQISIGDRTFIGGNLLCASNISIGNDVLIAFGTTIVDHDSHAISFENRKNDVINWYEGKKDWTHVKTNPIKISNKVWIGMHCIVLEGITIGEGAVIGAGSVVTKDVSPFTLVAGNPAQLIRKLSNS